MNLLQQMKSKTIALIALAMAVCIAAIACGGDSQVGSVGIAPEIVVDYIHKVAESDRTAYTKHVVNRLKKLEGNEKPKGVVNAEATEAWKEKNGIPLPAQMFRLGSELALADGDFTINLISSWNITEFEKTGIKQVEETGEPYKQEQKIGGKKYFSAIYPDIAVADACVTCHNSHPIHKERYPDKVFQKGDVMGGVVINLPLN